MTEEEAKTKWCPMARVTAGNGQFSYNRDEQGYHKYDGAKESFNCIASDCMMWVKEDDKKTPNGSEWAEDSDGQRYERQAYIVDKVGYCGLAGKGQ